ncbi:MAG: tRNA lysidine(34) synthetase TilS [Spirochaetaceae bacterium]|nr:tRNA lysidine(34) synthetase TilS [Spirochaetaceae bacterium]MCF7947982.1 tRNA lysidine(34) synthetase TilS [Spirochaetia bacterium]MCF7950873.1 tRNA lysidine(34) synthetase TilS [Spirochaetaceae bacterium]
MNSIAETLQTELLTSAKKAGLEPGDTLCIAYSGGPDSTALLSLLKSIQSELVLDLRAIYIDHGLRTLDERRQELRIVRSLCRSLDIPLYIKFLPPGYITRHDDEQLGTEASARLYRYVFLHKMAEITGSRFTALGHTSDDQVETVLMRCIQGSGPEGLKGISSQTEWLWRPLLNISKADLHEYLSKSSLSYSIDSSNTDTAFTRNYLRHTLLPSIREAFPGVDGALQTLADKMAAVEAVLAEREHSVPEIRCSDTQAEYPYDDFVELPLYIRVRLVYRLYNRWYPGSQQRLPYRFVRQLCDCRAAATYYRCGEGYGIRMEKRRGLLFWERPVVPNTKNSYLIVIQTGSFYLGTGSKIRFLSKAIEGSSQFRLKDVEFYSKGVCVIRSKRDGDMIRLRGGRKRINEALRESGIPEENRSEIALIEDQRGILAVIPLQLPRTILWSPFAKSLEEVDTRFEIMELKSERR